MYASIATALLGASALAAARPSEENKGWGTTSSSTTEYAAMPSSTQSHGWGWGNKGGSSTSSAADAGQSAFSFPLPNGFPNVSASALKDLEIAAQGVPGNGAAPMVSEDAKTSFRFIAFNELFEVAFFTELVNNITSGHYTVPNGQSANVLRALHAVQAQEEIHALGANNLLRANGANPIIPCKYDFPVDKFEDAIALASTFTDVTVGTLQDVQKTLAKDQDPVGTIQLIGSVIGQEGEQNGFYRNLNGKIPSALPFLTTSKREFAFSAINQNFIVRGSCPNLGDIKLPIFAKLDVLNVNPNQQPVNTTFKYAADNDNVYSGNPDDLSLVYINQQTLPIVLPLKMPQQNGNTLSFEADFPGDFPFHMNGLTIAVVARGKDFKSVNDVAAATLFGPALIEIN
nr:hypothetical protein B0A51_11459 [Rachicladosporium sp. CCFEE 5018]